jgi:hypothetical protein
MRSEPGPLTVQRARLCGDPYRDYELSVDVARDSLPTMKKKAMKKDETTTRMMTREALRAVTAGLDNAVRSSTAAQNQQGTTPST